MPFELPLNPTTTLASSCWWSLRSRHRTWLIHLVDGDEYLLSHGKRSPSTLDTVFIMGGFICHIWVQPSQLDSTYIHFEYIFVYFQQASAWFLSDDPFSEFAASGKTRSTSHLLGEFVWGVYFMVFSSMTQPRCIQDFCTDWIDSVTSEMWAKVFSQYSTCQSFKKRFRWLLRPVKTEGFFIQS